MSVNTVSTPIIFTPKAEPASSHTGKHKNPANDKPSKMSKVAYVARDGLDTARSVSNSMHQAFSSNYQAFYTGLLQLRSFMKISSLVDVVFLPFICANIAKQAHKFARGDRTVKIDAALEIIGELGLLGRTLTIITTGLASIGKVSAKVLELTPAFFLASSVLSFASTWSNYRTYKKMKTFEQKFTELCQLNDFTNESEGKSFEAAVMQFIICEQRKDVDFIQNTFNCTPEELRKVLLGKWKEFRSKRDSTNIEEQREGRLSLNKTLKTLKGHIRHVKNTSLMNIAIATITLVVATVLFASPAAPVTYALIGIGVAVNVGVLIHHKIVEYRYAKDLGLERKWYKWITC